LNTGLSSPVSDCSQISGWEPLETSLSSNRLGRQSRAISLPTPTEPTNRSYLKWRLVLHLAPRIVSFLSSVVAINHKRFRCTDNYAFWTLSKTRMMINHACSSRRVMTVHVRSANIDVITRSTSRHDATFYNRRCVLLNDGISSQSCVVVRKRLLWNWQWEAILRNEIVTNLERPEVWSSMLSINTFQQCNYPYHIIKYIGLSGKFVPTNLYNLINVY